MGESKLLLITAIKMADDYFDIVQKIKKTKNVWQVKILILLK